MRVLLILYLLVCSAIRNQFHKSHYLVPVHTISDILGLKARRPNPTVGIRSRADGEIVQQNSFLTELAQLLGRFMKFNDIFIRVSYEKEFR